MNVKPVRWLYGELSGLVGKGVIDEAAAARLRSHYGPLPGHGSSRNLLLTVFGALAALLIGGGISLLVAHNWEDLGRPLRAAISIALLLSAQALVAWVLSKRGSSRAWTEGSALFLALAVVTTIALVSQTYNMPGDLEGLLFTWMLLIIPLVYLLSSTTVTALVWVGTTWWLLEGPWWIDSLLARPSWYLLLAGSTAPFLVRLWHRRREEGGTALLGWTVGGSLLVAVIRTVDNLGGDLWIPFLAGTVGTYYVVGLHQADHLPESPPAWRRPFHTIGALGLAMLMLSLSSTTVWRGDWSFRSSHIETLVLLVVGLALCAISTLGAIELATRRRFHQAMFGFLPAVAVAAWLLTQILHSPEYATLLVNLAALGTGLTVCAYGARQGKLGTANGGLLLVVVILAARFFDSDLSFIVRGVGFILLGMSLLAVNLLVLRRRKEEA